MSEAFEKDFYDLQQLLEKEDPDAVRRVPTVENLRHMLLVARDVVPEPDNEKVFEILERFKLRPITGRTPKVSRASRRVCLVERKDGSEATGVLIGPDLLLTAAHALLGTAGVYADPSQVLIKFDEFIWSDNTKAIGVVCGLRPNAAGDQPEVIASSIKVDAQGRKYEDNGLDYIIVRLDRPVGRAFLPRSRRRIRGWMDVSSADIPPESGPVSVLQHPRGELLQIADGRIPSTDIGTGVAGHFRYSTEAHHGASGAPILNPGKILVGIHVGTIGDEHEGISWQAIFADVPPHTLIPNPGHQPIADQVTSTRELIEV